MRQSRGVVHISSGRTTGLYDTLSVNRLKCFRTIDDQDVCRLCLIYIINKHDDVIGIKQVYNSMCVYINVCVSF